MSQWPHIHGRSGAGVFLAEPWGGGVYVSDRTRRRMPMGYEVRGYGAGWGWHTGFGDAEADAAVSYRALWDNYVTSSIRALDATADSLDTASKSPPSGFSAAQLSSLAASYRTEATDYLNAWNQFANTSPEDLGAQAAVAVKEFEDTVTKLQALWAKGDVQGKWYFGPVPTEPSPAAQAQVQQKIDSSGVLTKNIVELTADEKVWELKNAIPWTTILYVGGAILIAIFFVPPLLESALLGGGAVYARRRAA